VSATTSHADSTADPVDVAVIGSDAIERSAGHGSCRTLRHPITCERHMSDYKHDSSDKKLDHAADAVKATAVKHDTGPGHDPAKIARHDDAGKDRLFEHREQHDDAEQASERSRREKDVKQHDHPVSDASGS